MNAVEMKTPGPIAADQAPRKTNIHIFDEVERAEKIKATVMAQAALVGLSVFELADASYCASRWGYITALPDLAAVRALVRKMGGAA